MGLVHTSELSTANIVESTLANGLNAETKQNRQIH